MKVFSTIVCVTAILLGSGFARENLAQAADSPRLAHRFGISGSLFAEPFPTIWGVALNFNALDFLRVTAGYGRVDYQDSTLNIGVTTMGLEGKFLLPRAALSPFASLGVSTLSGTLQGSGKISVLGSLDEGRSTLTFGGGLDYQSRGGFNVGVAIKTAQGNGGKWVPGLYAGYYFK